MGTTSITTSITTLVLLAAAPLASQVTGYWYSPASLSKGEGGGSSQWFGAYLDQRMQQVDGELRGKVGSIKEISMRLDYRNVKNQGRTFHSVTIDMADSDFARVSTSFAKNLTSAPTRVFSSSVTWPTLNGAPLRQPDFWGGLTGAYRYPFKSAWLTSGTRDIVSDWVFSGGRLVNGHGYSAPYDYDSHAQLPVFRTAIDYRLHPSIRLDNNSPGVTGRCNDSAFTETTGAWLRNAFAAYGPHYYANAQWRNKTVMFSYTHLTAPAATVVHAWGLQLNSKGVDIGTGCNKLHVGQIVLLQSWQTLPLHLSATGFSGYSTSIILPIIPVAKGQRVVTQAAWADSKTGRLNLSQAASFVVPDLQFSAPPRRAAVYSYKIALVGWRGPFGPFFDSQYQVGLRYGY